MTGSAPAWTARSAVPDVAVLATVGYWATALTWGFGGRDARHLTVLAVLVAAAYLLVQPWRTLPPAVLVLANAVAVAAVLVVATAPTGWNGRHDAASYVVCAQLYLVVAAWARDRRRVALLLLVLAGAGGAQFAQGWLAWWGGEDPARPFLGTFYWHNQSGTFLAAGALTAYGLVLRGDGPARRLAWVVAPVAGAGVLFSTSRGAQLALLLGVVLLLLSQLLQGRAGRPAPQCARLGGAVLATWAVSLLLTGPPFFAGRSSPLAGTGRRGTAEPLTGNTAARLDHWWDALTVLAHWPLTGAGFGSFSSATAQVSDDGRAAPTSFAHNGFLQAAADGGLVLAVPLSLGLLAVLVLGARSLRARTDDAAELREVAVVLLVVLLLHSAIDFDWAYPSLLGLTAIVAGLAWRPAQARRPSRLRTAAVLLVAPLLVVAAVGGWQHGQDRNFSVVGERS